MTIYGFRAGPSFRAGSPQQRMLDALDTPLSPLATMGASIAQTFTENVGLGTAVRDFSIPRLPMPRSDGLNTALRANPLSAGIVAGYDAARDLFGAQATGKLLDETGWKASPYFRESIPFDAGMTEDRAAALALFADTKAVREFYAKKQPIAAFAGTILGSALDPINFIPTVGPLVKAAALAKFGRIGGAALAASLDASVNVAVAGAVTAPTRAQFGDDVSWQAQISDVAMAAMIGGAFGIGEGAIGRFRDGRASAKRDAAIKAATDKLQTLKRVQEARIGLNEAAVSLALDGEVRMSPNGLDPVADLARELIPDVVRNREVVSPPRDAAGIDPLPAASNAPAEVPISLAQPARSIEPEVSGLERALNDLRTGAGFRDVSMKRPIIDMLKRMGGVHPDSPLAAELRNVGVTSKSAPGLFRREAMTIATKDGPLTREPLRAVDNVPLDEVAERFAARGKGDGAGYVDQQSWIDAVRDEMAGDPWLTRSEQQRFDEVRKPVEDLDEFLNRFDIEVEGRTNAEVMADIRSVERRLQAGFDASPGRGEITMSDADLDEWGSAWAADERPATMNAQWRIDPDKGSYLEEGDIRQLEMEGRLTDEDRAELDAANQMFTEGAAYGKALEAAVTCLL